MSLLLEALKKAEKAKEEAQRRSGEAAPAPELALQREEPAKRVLTRSELPDISPSLEILSDDIAPKRGDDVAPKRGGAAPETLRPAGAPPAPARPAAASGTEASLQRAAARKVFEAKFKESNPRLPFFIALGVLGVFAFGTVGYFWYQLRPPAPLVASPNPAPPPGERPVIAKASPAGTPGAGAAAPIAGLPGGTGTSIPGLPGAAVVAPLKPPPTPPAEPSGAKATPPRDPLPSRAATRLSRAPEQAPAQPSAPRAVLEVQPKVQSGYAAYLAGNLQRAREDYEQALRDDPTNRDALLGLAAVDLRSGRLEAAETAYARLLQANPRDPHAQAGLLALRAGRVDPLAAESRVKSLLAADPAAHVLYFTLGNQLAQQERWSEAQQQYFKAFAAEPENADFAYNLAVSLDHLRQPKLALEYYQRSLSLAAARGASFDLGAARERAAQLAK